MIALWLFAGAAVVLGGLHLTARVVCSRKGHRWKHEVRDFDDGTQAIGMRCQRCREWAG